MNRTHFRLHTFLLALMLLLLTCAFAGCAKEPPRYADLDFSAVDPASCTETDQITNYVKLSVTITDGDVVTDCEDIIIRLYPEVAPKTVANFQKLVSEKFYDGLTFHRVVKGFMIQGGDPEGDGTGDSGETIKGEFSLNGFTNNLKHVRGVVSMARAPQYNSASCQFFIMHDSSKASSLNGKYAAFGYVVSGMKAVDTIAELPVKNNADGSERSVPIATVTIESIRFVQP